MTIFFALIIVCFIFSVKITREFNISYLDKNNANVVKGVFLLLVFFRLWCYGINYE